MLTAPPHPICLIGSGAFRLPSLALGQLGSLSGSVSGLLLLTLVFLRTLDCLGSGIRPPDHRTTLLFEHHYVGRDGLPVHHHSQQTIYSLVEGLTSYQYRFDTAEAEVRVKRGGTAGEAYPIGHGYYAIDINFPHPLEFGQSQYLDYWTNFHYSEAPLPEFRRGTHQRVEHLDMRVEFHRDKLPRQLWWAEWSNYIDIHRDVVEREDVTLDEERSAHKYLDAIEHTVVGFYWEW